MPSTARTSLVLAALAAFITPAAAAMIGTIEPSRAEEPEGLQPGVIQHYLLDSSPFSGPVEVIVNTDHPTAARGTFTDVFVAVQNHSNEATASVVIELDLRYADGRAVRPFHLGVERAQTLGPDEGVGFFIFWVVPEDAPPGTATFKVSARVGRLSGGSDGHDQNPNPMVASDSVTFEVVP